MDIFRRKAAKAPPAPKDDAASDVERAQAPTLAESSSEAVSPNEAKTPSDEDLRLALAPTPVEEQVPRSIPPPPPSRRPHPLTNAQNVAAVVLPPPLHAPTPPPPAPTHETARVQSSVPGRVDIHSSLDRSERRVTTALSSQRPRDPVRALHERELEKLRAQHAELLQLAHQEKEEALAALRAEHEAQLERLQEQWRVDHAAAEAEQVRRAQSMRRRISIAATLALEDRLGLLRHLETENDELRRRIVELEQEAGAPISTFSTRPKMPSLPPEMFSSTSVPPPDPEPHESHQEASDADQAEPAPSESPLLLEPSISAAKTALPSRDDLTQLKGIGPAIARSLSKIGVRSLSQIAAWTDEDIEAIAPKVRTRPNRIRKDGWVKSAQRLLAQRAATQQGSAIKG